MSTPRLIYSEDGGSNLPQKGNEFLPQEPHRFLEAIPSFQRFLLIFT